MSEHIDAILAENRRLNIQIRKLKRDLKNQDHKVKFYDSVVSAIAKEAPQPNKEEPSRKISGSEDGRDYGVGTLNTIMAGAAF